MNAHPQEGELHRHYDGELPAKDSWEIEAHLRECGACAAEYDRIREIVDSVGELSESVEPPVDLWAGIASRIGAPANGTVDELERRRRRRSRVVRATVIASWLGAVAAALVLGVGLGRLFPDRDAPLASGEVEVDAVQASAPNAVLASYQEPAYDDAVAELEAVLAEMRQDLDPETVRVVEENLAVIDGAIQEAREALLADPANQQLHRHLSTNMQMKLRLLRTVTAAISNT